MDGSETYLFRARSAEEQAMREAQVRLILSSLEEASGAPAPVLVVRDHYGEDQKA